MSCNGCRVLRKGCSESCILRPCLQWIESADAQGHATVFVAKFFGRAGLMGFITAVPETQRPALFQSLLYEACGRTVNPVFGAVGLLWAGNWQVCQAAVETVLKGGSLKAPSPGSQTFSTLPQGPLHPSNPGKDTSAASRGGMGRESLLPSIITSTKEHNVDAHDLKARVVGTGPGNQFLRVSNGYESKLEAKPRWDRKWDVNQGPTAKGNVVVNSHVITWPESKLVLPKVGEKRERDLSMGAAAAAPVLTPAPRRVRVGGEYGYGMLLKDPKFLYDDEETVVGSTEHLDLGLTLKVKDGKGLKRVYSPSCDSVNSEGSVTSLDTTPRHHHHASFSSQMGFGHGDHMKLLPLLL